MAEMNRRAFIGTSLAAATAAAVPGLAAAQVTEPVRAATSDLAASVTGAEDRRNWVGVVDKLARPVLIALRDGKLDAILRSRAGARPARLQYAPLEALGRLLAGIAPWLEHGPSEGDEGKLREDLAGLAREGIRSATDPASASFMNFNRGDQPLVDAAFLAHAIIRAPGELFEKLGPAAKKNLAAALKSSRVQKPHMSNWLLFSAMVEAGLAIMNEDWLADPVELAVSKHQEWYKGDGAYGDGPAFHWDYYNSFVIQPMLVDVLETLGGKKPAWEALKQAAVKRMRRYATVQERMISPEGTYPVFGRSLVYRFGAFQALSQMALRKELEEGLKPAQVRCALTAVIRKIIEFPGAFDADGFLAMGICGRQLQLTETYISPGSPYLCSAGLLALGLPPSDEFWSAPAADWTAKKIWAGAEVPSDHALAES